MNKKNNISNGQQLEGEVDIENILLQMQKYDVFEMAKLYFSEAHYPTVNS